MKRLVGACLALAMSLAVGTASSGDITFHTGSVGGLFMEVGVIWAEQMQESIPGLKVSCILGGGMTNPIAVSQGDPNANMGLTDTVTAIDAYNGLGEYEKRMPGGTKNLRALWRLNINSWIHVLARPESVPEGVNTFGELLEKNPEVKLQMKPAASDPTGPRLLETYGYTFDSIREKGASLIFNNPSDMATLLIDGHADVAIACSRAPAAYVLDMEASIPGLRWLALDKPSMEKLRDKYGYVIGEQPAGDYASLPEALPTAGLDQFVFVHENMDEEMAYQMTKLILSNPAKVQNAIAAAKTFDPKLAGTSIPFPLHKGAIRAYKELGLPYDE